MAVLYDRVADWWDGIVVADTRGLFAASRAVAGGLLGSGPGLCLDLACGTGRTAAKLAESGWEIVGIDLSQRQLELAAPRLSNRVRGDAHRLPFKDTSFDAVVMTFLHTDLDGFAGVAKEAARVLRPAGRLVAVELHPCFISPLVQPTPDGGRFIKPGYLRNGWYTMGEGFDRPDSLRRRIGGTYHLTLAQLLNAFIDAGFTLQGVQEPYPEPIPELLAIVAQRPQVDG